MGGRDGILRRAGGSGCVIWLCMGRVNEKAGQNV
jgi:hypothetical protein